MSDDNQTETFGAALEAADEDLFATTEDDTDQLFDDLETSSVVKTSKLFQEQDLGGGDSCGFV